MRISAGEYDYEYTLYDVVSDAKVRKDKDIKSDLLAALPAGQQVRVLEISGTRARVRFEGDANCDTGSGSDSKDFQQRLYMIFLWSCGLVLCSCWIN